MDIAGDISYESKTDADKIETELPGNAIEDESCFIIDATDKTFLYTAEDQQPSTQGLTGHPPNKDVPVLCHRSLPSEVRPKHGSHLHVRHAETVEYLDGVDDNTTDKNVEESGYVVVQKPENQVEAQRLANNILFGQKKWKSHITARPLSDRSTIVQELYSDQEKIPSASTVSTVNFGNIVYVLLFGWWLALLYAIVAILMAITIIGKDHCFFCIKLADYYIWPFGQFVKSNVRNSERTYLLSITRSSETSKNERHTSLYWKRPSTYIWLLLGAPILFIAHGIVFLISWFLVIFIPVAKVNLKSIKKIILLPPECLEIESFSMNTAKAPSDIILYTQQAVNLYYYKYTVDGMNVILVNLLLFVILALTVGYADSENEITSSEAKFILALLAIIPLAYYIGQAITSLAAQSNFAVGAVLNATFGSIVEITLYISSLIKGYELNTMCYDVLVKSALAGTLLATMLLIPGICMILGGLKHQLQTFNPRSAVVSSSLLFVSVAGLFAPTIFAKIFGTLECQKCMYNVTTAESKILGNHTFDLRCTMCEYSVFGLATDKQLYNDHIRPLVYVCAIILPCAYLIGLVFSLKTHSRHVHGNFVKESQKFAHDTGHKIAHWSRWKSFFILLISTTLMSLCAELVTSHIHPLLKNSGISVYFIGVTLLALVPDIPEIVNGMQFALQNNINLSIEVGTSIAVQVCMLQFPILVLFDIIHPVEFFMVFSDLLLWTVIFAVIVMNYIFQDGKSDYLQGTALCGIYIILVVMYFVAPDIGDSEC